MFAGFLPQRAENFSSCLPLVSWNLQFEKSWLFERNDGLLNACRPPPALHSMPFLSHTFGVPELFLLETCRLDA